MYEPLSYSVEVSDAAPEDLPEVGAHVRIAVRAEPGGSVEQIWVQILATKSEGRAIGKVLTDPKTEVRAFLRAGSQVPFMTESILP